MTAQGRIQQQYRKNFENLVGLFYPELVPTDYYLYSIGVKALITTQPYIIRNKIVIVVITIIS